MARGRKKHNQHTPADNSSSNLGRFRPNEFEEIEFTKLPPEKPEGEFEEIDIHAATVGTRMPKDQLLAAKNQLEHQFLYSVSEQAFSAQSGTTQYGFENIVGVGISQKLVNNRFTGDECVTVYVVAKAPKDQIHEQALVPEKIHGIPTDVVATGEFHAFPHRGLYRPAPGGVSIGHYQITAGTLACLVRRGSQLFILSNNHVLANINQGIIGDPILQPGPFDGGQLPDNVIAQLSQYVTIQFGGQPNQVDCAIAQASPSLVTPLNKCFGRINSTPFPCQRFLVVKKCGRTTQFTLGLITDCNATIKVGYGTAGNAIFQDQIMIFGIPFIAPFSAPGDSGSLIVEEFTNRPVGLLFAGTSLFTLANKIDNVLSILNVSIVN